MDKLLNVINASGSSCGSCHSTGCGTCGPAPSKSKAPAVLSRRDFGYSALAASASVLLAGCSQQKPPETAAQPAAAAPALSPELGVVQTSRGPIMTTLEEFYKMGPGPSSSHTMGPMRITYDFYRRCTNLPADQLANVTGLKVHLYGSLSATGKGHGTDRAALAGIIGKAPATVAPEFLH